MAGYKGYSMSNNAVEAYRSGEKPLSRWTKHDIIEAAKEIDEEKAEHLKRVPLAVLKNRVLEYVSWHHTSSRYNRTEFYCVSESRIERLSIDDIDALSRRKPQSFSVKRYRGTLEYLEWSGTRAHPKANKVFLKDVIIEEKGSFYRVLRDDGSLIIRKKIGSNGTYVYMDDSHD